MNKHFFHRVTTLMLAMTILLLSSAKAKANSSAWELLDADLKSKAETFTELRFGQTTPDKLRYVDSPSGNTHYLYAEYENGYMIMNLTDGFIAESGEGRIFTDDTEDYIYNGGLEYYKVCNGTAEHLKSEKTYPLSEMTDVLTPASQLVPLQLPSSDAIQSVPEVPAFVYISTPIFHFADRPTDIALGYGYCGPLAAANFLRYMDYHYYNSTLLNSDHQTADGLNLMDALIELIETMYPSITVKYNGTDHYHLREAIGVYAYLKNKTLYVNSSSTWNTTTYCNSITSNKPVLAGIPAGTPGYDGDHWVTGVGFYMSEYWTVEMILFYDEDGTQKTLHPSYFYRMVY